MESGRVFKLKAYEFLCASKYGVLSTVSSYNTPQGALVVYVVKDRVIYFITSKDSRKVKNLQHRPKAALTVFANSNSVLQIEGSTAVVTDSNLKSEISQLYLEKSASNKSGIVNEELNWPPVMKLPHDQGFEFIELSIVWFKYSNFSQEETIVVEGNENDWV